MHRFPGPVVPARGAGVHAAGGGVWYDVGSNPARSRTGRRTPEDGDGATVEDSS